MTADEAVPAPGVPTDAVPAAGAPSGDDGQAAPRTADAALSGEQPGDIPFEQAAAEHENPALS
ncbi:hypothetical protein IT072_12655 [Leifsonia sp. ZF2019]|uniref:hypothetical protein n=1 Tax=Leifsonia sp. ZF2019 TaxID=2781978 RepID=UPI001CBB4A61|nr:hypothetical protein [Leifsonia sp. ZF2019]UAJ78127.1 hypothetical protein IT072_12655 [Leifsonia sp. ZF2019]